MWDYLKILCAYYFKIPIWLPYELYGLYQLRHEHFRIVNYNQPKKLVRIVWDPNYDVKY